MAFRLNKSYRLVLALMLAGAALAEQTELQSVESTQMLQQVADLQRDIAQLEQITDTFDPRVGELNLALANRLMELDQQEAALEAIRRADQNIKVNFGLYAPEREPLIRMAFASQIAMRNIEAAEAELGHLSWLAARSLKTQDPEYIPRLLELARWHFSRYLAEANEESLKQLERAIDYLQDAREVYQANGLNYSGDFLDLYLAVNKASSEFLPGVQVSRTTTEAGRFDRDRMRLERLVGDVCDLGYQHSEDEASRCERSGEALLRRRLLVSTDMDYANNYSLDVNHTALFVNRSYQRGRQVLDEAYRQSLEQADPAEHVSLLLKTADWFLLFGHQANAREVYQLAAVKAAEFGIEAEFALHRPHPIPPSSVYEKLVNLAEVPVSGGLRMQVVVDDEGKIDRIEAANIDLQDAAEAGNISSQIVRTRFRPALLDGQPVEFEGYEFDVRY